MELTSTWLSYCVKLFTVSLRKCIFSSLLGYDTEILRDRSHPAQISCVALFRALHAELSCALFLLSRGLLSLAVCVPALGSPQLRCTVSSRTSDLLSPRARNELSPGEVPGSLSSFPVPGRFCEKADAQALVLDNQVHGPGVGPNHLACIV